MTIRSRTRAVLAAAAGSTVALGLWLAVAAPLAMGLLHPSPVAPPTAPPAGEASAPVRSAASLTAAVLLSQAGTEVTDFLAPFAILAASGAFTVHAVAPLHAPAPTNGGLGIMPHLTLAELDALHPDGVDVVVLPNVLDPDAPVLLDWVRRQAARGALVASICEGARLLAGTGLLEGRAATSHFAALGVLRAAYPGVRWRDDRRWVEDGTFATSAGVTAAIDASLHVVARLAGDDAAARAASALALPPPGDAAAAAPELSAGDLAIGLLQGAFAWPRRRVFVRLANGIDEIALAAALDAYPRTFAARSASTTPGRRAVRSRHGLVLVPSRAEEPARGDDIVLTPALEASAGPAFDRVLTAVARDFGGRTAALVADQLEYPAAGLRLDASPTPLARLLVRLVLLLGVGALSGLAVRSAWCRRRGRRIAARATLVLALAVSLPGPMGCGGPLGPLAGGRLSGR